MLRIFSLPPAPLLRISSMQKQSFKTTIGDRELIADFTDLAAHAHGSVIMRSGETAVLVTAVMSDRENTSANYFPLSVEFEERFYAAGQILGSRFMRREGKPSDEAILSARIIDRTIRPLFDHSIRYDVQVVATVLAMGEEDPDVLAVIGASLALSTSSIPWNGPIGAVRIGMRTDGTTVINPSYHDREEGSLSFEVLACGRDNTINMIETAANEIDEATILAVLKETTALHAEIVSFQRTIIAAIGKEKRILKPALDDSALKAHYEANFKSKLFEAMFSDRPGKDHIYEVKDAFLTSVAQALPDVPQNVASNWFETRIDETLHEGVLAHNKRPDGRSMDQVRELYAQAGDVSPALHGSGIFYRGGTHIFSALTLGGPEAAQVIDTIESLDTKKRFMHHYNFPPFSVGETGRVGGQNRRMIGHGALAEKALVPVLPPKEVFPYTIRLVSETLSSNGSSSMGSVCASTLAMMDGGVPITRPVAGIASGLMMHGEQYAVLTDIQGPEDEFGDMDFKVAGTTVGVTAIQMDVKVDGVPLPALEVALEKARLARLHILNTMEAAIAAPRPSISPRAPKIVSLSIPPAMIGLVIGSGGKTINGIKEETGVEEISIEDDGTVFITGKGDAPEAAASRIKAMTRVYVVGEELTATVTRLAPFGVFVKLSEQHDAMVHISEIASFRIDDAATVLKIGDVVPVKIIKVEDGKIGGSIKAADPNFVKRPNGMTPEIAPAS